MILTTISLMRVTIILAALSLLSLFYLSSCGLVLAQTDDSLVTEVSDPGSIEIGESLITPDSPLYFLKTLRENIEIVFSSSKQSKVIRQLEFAQRRLREVRGLVKNRKQDLIPSTLERYKLFIDQAQEIARGDESLQAKVAEELSRHLYVLQTVYDTVGNPRAKQAIRAALIRAEEQNSQIVSRLETARQQSLIKKIAARQAFACKFLIREATSSALNDTEREYLKEKVNLCRSDARGMFKDELQDLRRHRALPAGRQASPSAIISP